MAGPDSFYTPQHLAEKLVGFVTEKNIKNAIDFCIGNGDLLKAAQNRFDKIKFYGTDISNDIIDKISCENPTWTLGVCDFRKDESVEKISFLKELKFDLILFNPPFTCKGSIVEKIIFEGVEFKVSTAMMFIMRAIKYLSPRGGIYAILPISCAYSQKDREAWNYLKINYNACILEEPERVSFCNLCSPKIVLVYIGNQSKGQLIKDEITVFSNLCVDSVVRGSIRMQNLKYSNSNKALRLIHTTNIQKGKLVKMSRILPGSQLIIDGYGVVIPRVCNPNPKKIALLDGQHRYVLSDCVIVLRTSKMEMAEQVRTHILNNWPTFAGIYKGTGAQYTTIERVKTLFGLI